MKPRLTLSLLLLLALGAGLYAFWPQASVPPSAKTGEQSAPAPRKTAAAKAEAPAPAPAIELPKPASKRDEKVVAQLKVFMERTKDMTEASVQAEQERIKQGIKDSEARETEVPQSQLITDENGESWERLEFQNGQVRYRPVPRGGKTL